jgi:hypothetical protein
MPTHFKTDNAERVSLSPLLSKENVIAFPCYTYRVSANLPAARKWIVRPILDW